MKGKIHIGTSGWHYAHWKGPFYPKELPDQDMLPYYQQFFSTVEINNTFYQLPQIATVKHWLSQVSKSFLFSVKASRYITHVKRLKDPKQSLKRFFSCIHYLENQLGVILFQLPSQLKKNLDRLQKFLEALPDKKQVAFEFRNAAWLDDEVFELLEKHRVIFCIYDFDRFKTPDIITSKTVYLRLHGPKGAYEGSYASATLKAYAKQFQSWASQGLDVFCYFDNDQNGFAPKNALQLQDFIN